MNKYQKKYSLPLTVLFLIGFVFCGKAVAGKNRLQTHGDITVSQNGDFTIVNPFNPLSDKNRQIMKDEIESVLKKEKYLQKELDKELHILQKKITRQDFKTPEIESLIKQVHNLQIEFYRILLPLLDKIKTDQAGIHEGFIGRGPIFEQAPVGKAHDRP